MLSTSDPLVKTDAFSLSILYALIGSAMFYIGYYTKFGVAISKLIPSLGTNWSRFRLKMAVILLSVTCIALLLFFMYVVTGKGILFHLTHSLQIAHEYLKIGAFWVNGAIGLISSAFFLLYAYSINPNRKINKIVLALFFVMAIGISLIQGVRAPIIVLLAGIIILRHYCLGKVIKIKHLIIGIPVLFGLLTVLNYFRLYGQEMFMHLSIESLPMDVYTTILVGLEPFKTLMTIIESVPEKVGFQYGLYYLYLAIAWIPRALWPDKPIVGVEWFITETIYGHDPSMTSAQTPTLIGDLYLNLHIPAIIIGMFVWGVFWKMVYSYLLIHKKNAGIVLIYAILLTSGINTIRGSFSGFVITTLMAVLPVMIAIVYINGGKLIVRHERLK
jgi:oligosaccharide repeat unit polymerase